MDDDAPSLEDAQAAMRDAGMRGTLEADEGDWCWHVAGCSGKPRVIDPDTGSKVLLSRWLLDHYGSVPLGSDARWWPATCGDATCVNPEHWEAKREYERPQPKRYGWSPYVSTKQRSKRPLTPGDHMAIRTQHGDGWSLNALAEEYEVHRSTISKIVNQYGNYGFTD